MADRKKDVFALVFESGRAQTVTRGGLISNEQVNDYWAVLEQIALTFNASGFSSDYPKTLLRNGQPVEGRPVDLATRYVSDMVKARDAALQQTREKHRPEWMEAPADVS